MGCGCGGRRRSSRPAISGRAPGVGRGVRRSGANLRQLGKAGVPKSLEDQINIQKQATPATTANRRRIEKLRRAAIRKKFGK